MGLVPAWGGGGWLAEIDAAGQVTGPVRWCADGAALARAVAEREAAEKPRWLWPTATAVYPALLAAGVRVERCHDVELVESLLVGYEGHWGEPRSLAAALARARGLPVPPDRPPRPRDTQPVLFAADVEATVETTESLDVLAEVYRAQLRRIAAVEHPDRFRLLVAAESAGALAAAEMGHDGLPWSAERHDALLESMLGARPLPGDLPARLHELAADVRAAFGGMKVNPDAPADVVRAFGRVGIQIPSTRSWVLKRVEHPAVAPILAYKELSRIFAAHGWSWQDTWVSGGRMRPEYVAGGVVSGRWATRGGAALQLPKAVRQAVVADPGHVFVAADASALEPRVLAAMSGDRRLAEFAAAGDLYTALAADAFDNDRARAKLGMLGALYGQTSGEGGRLAHVLRRRFPDALAAVDSAARAGEEGRLVRSRLGRTCPPPGRSWLSDPGGEGSPTGEAPALDAIGGRSGGGGTDGAGGGAGGHGDGASGDGGFGDAGEGEPGAADQARRAARGRFTRNFLVQATAAEWALIWLVGLRRRLGPTEAAGARLVFFVHDEVVVHCPEPMADEVRTAVLAAADEARRLLFGETPVRFPLDVAVVRSYADA
ncbi:bifunctional 3'-5' exonuclease/DNA polymerase [Cryptosporangium arvum]|uniref:DNA-directed DNA polymerase n=1 Tax=Cryptosporangium arvum DSM 44712 TaxID=927661 RepID=A0A011AFF4_9ACTN|nr:bifunctional 3'-5' exonuclease/DNA polymerase [Cryptosporangium arvum]EXG80741.1 DNA polymerase I family protein with 3'-5'-exonuclease and polymerase domains [Cryptosporangium arvum DSM 44712]